MKMTKKELVRREARALELRKAGVPLDKIAEIIGYASVQSANNAIRRALERVRDPIAEDILYLELARLDSLLEAHWETALSGDVKSTETCLNIMKRRGAILGLDKVNLDLTNSDGKLGGPVIYMPQMDTLFDKE